MYILHYILVFSCFFMKSDYFMAISSRSVVFPVIYSAMSRIVDNFYLVRHSGLQKRMFFLTLQTFGCTENWLMTNSFERPEIHIYLHYSKFAKFLIWFQYFYFLLYIPTRKYPLRWYILGVLSHTTAWNQLWGGDVSLRFYVRSSASPRMAVVWQGLWNSDYVVLKSSIHNSALPCSAAVWLGFWKSEYDETR